MSIRMSFFCLYSLQLGEEACSFGYGGTGKTSVEGRFMVPGILCVYTVLCVVPQWTCVV